MALKVAIKVKQGIVDRIKNVLVNHSTEYLLDRLNDQETREVARFTSFVANSADICHSILLIFSHARGLALDVVKITLLGPVEFEPDMNRDRSHSRPRHIDNSSQRRIATG